MIPDSFWNELFAQLQFDLLKNSLVDTQANEPKKDNL